MKWQYNDGGRAAAGYTGAAGDCVTRSVAIATGLPYQQVYDALSKGCASERRIKIKRGKAVYSTTARNGVRTQQRWFKEFMQSLGWVWTPTMLIGSGCKVHLTDGELPMGRLVVAVSKHYTAVIDGVIHDTFNPQREVHVTEPDTGRELKPGETRNINGISRISRRCVYGYWKKGGAS
jgi:hypothetical protein